MNGEVERYKTRLIVKRYCQIVGIDYEETFSSVLKIAIVRTAISLEAIENWCIYQMDINNVFLQGNLTEKVFMELPKGLQVVKIQPVVCKLVKSLYGLKQASRQWNFKLTEALLKSKYSQSHLDYSLSTKNSR